MHPGGSLLLPQAGKPHALQVQVLPARSSGALTVVHLAALAFIADPGAVPPSRARTLRELYKLTPTESRLADLFLPGQELKQTAEELKLSYESTRFHLKQIFRKTNTTRQAELLRLLLAIPE
jgi:DNA-binding CsgD family transcriptional regulator